MTKKSINELINIYSLPISECLIEEGLIKKSKDLIKNLGYDDKSILLVSDNALNDISSQLINFIDSDIKSFILEKPEASQKFAALIEKECDNIDLIIAVGSGTINDLCKITSFRKNIPYVIFATATSMNGYASANASIKMGGMKKTIPAHMPKAIYCDLNILRDAPIDLIKAGIGDSLCYHSCYFDWMLSHLILKTNFNHEVFEFLQPYQNELLNSQLDINDSEFIKNLCEILIISGFAMYICKGSYPASQGEHLMAHFLEMKYPDIAKKYFHGQQIAVTTLTMVDIQIKLLEEGSFNLKNQNLTSSYYNNLFDGDESVILECSKSLNSKKVNSDNLENINDNFKLIKKDLEKNMISKESLLKFYKKFNLIKEFEELKADDDRYIEIVDNAYLIRDRLTALDFKIRTMDSL